MNNKKILIFILLAFSGLILGGYLLYKYNEYKGYSYAIQRIPQELKIPEFYARFMRFPKNSLEYLDFVKNDSEYVENLRSTGCILAYDSSRNTITMYSPGFDDDDDQLSATYNPLDVSFPSSFVKDGDVIMQVQRLADFIPDVLSTRRVALRDGIGDSTLKPTLGRLVKLSRCYADTVISLKDRQLYPIPPLEIESDYGRCWIEVRKINGNMSVKIYGKMDDSLLQRVERGLLAEIEDRRILEQLDNVEFGLSINFLGLIFCDEN